MSPPQLPTPSSASLRRASRLDNSPSTWSVAISSAMYRCSGVTFASMHRQCRTRLDASGFAQYWCAMDWTPDGRGPARPGGRGRRSDARRRPGHCRGARRGGRNRGVHGSQFDVGRQEVRLRPTRNHRGDRRAGRRSRWARRRHPGRPPRGGRGARAGAPDPRRLRTHRHPGQRHLGRRGAQGPAADVEQADMGARPGRLVCGYFG